MAKRKIHGGVKIKGLTKFQLFDGVYAENGMIVFQQKEKDSVRLLPSEALGRVRQLTEGTALMEMAPEMRVMVIELYEQVYQAYLQAKSQQEHAADDDVAMVRNLDNGKMADAPELDLRLSAAQILKCREWKFKYPWISQLELSTMVRSDYPESTKEGMLNEINQERSGKRNLKALRDGLEDSPLLNIKR